MALQFLCITVIQQRQEYGSKGLTRPEPQVHNNFRCLTIATMEGSIPLRHLPSWCKPKSYFGGGDVHSLVWVPEVFEEFWNVVSKHIIHRLYHLGFDLLKPVDAIPTQDISEVLDVREISCWKMMLPLYLLPQTTPNSQHENYRGEKHWNTSNELCNWYKRRALNSDSQQTTISS